jgi:hypothetical protein
MTDMITTPIDERVLRGALELERTQYGVLPHRLPAWARQQFPDEALARAEAQPSGVRLVFRTKATAIELDVLATKTAYQGIGQRPDGIYDLVVDGNLSASATAAGGNVATIDMMSQTATVEPGPPSTVAFRDLSPALKDVVLWLPHIEKTELIALRTDAPVDLAAAPSKVWLHHGSSISHGSTAARPTETWPALAAMRGGVELINLGFSGNALLDPFTARAMRDTPADLISLKLGINLTNTDLMRVRAFVPAVHGFLDTIRDGHPETPLLVISSILCPIQEDTPGPLMPDPDSETLSFKAMGEPAPGKLTLRVIRDELTKIVAQRTDPNLHYLGGRDLYGEADFAEDPLPDRIHPSPAGHRRIGENFAEQVFGPDGLWGKLL